MNVDWLNKKKDGFYDGLVSCSSLYLGVGHQFLVWLISFRASAGYTAAAIENDSSWINLNMRLTVSHANSYF